MRLRKSNFWTITRKQFVSLLLKLFNFLYVSHNQIIITYICRWIYHRRFRSLLFVSHVCRALSFPFIIADLKLRVNGTLWRTDRADRLQTSRVAGGEEGSIVITAHRKVVVVIARTVVVATRQRSLRRRTGPDNRKGSFAVTSHVYCQWADQNKWFDISPVQSPATVMISGQNANHYK